MNIADVNRNDVRPSVVDGRRGSAEILGSGDDQFEGIAVGSVRLNVVAGDDVNVAVTVGRRQIFVVEDLTRTARRQWGRVSVTVGQLKDIRRSAGLQLRHSGRRRPALKDGQKGGDITGVKHRRQ